MNEPTNPNRYLTSTFREFLDRAAPEEVESIRQQYELDETDRFTDETIQKRWKKYPVD